MTNPGVQIVCTLTANGADAQQWSPIPGIVVVWTLGWLVVFQGARRGSGVRRCGQRAAQDFCQSKKLQCAKPCGEMSFHWGGVLVECRLGAVAFQSVVQQTCS